MSEQEFKLYLKNQIDRLLFQIKLNPMQGYDKVYKDEAVVNIVDKARLLKT